MHLKRTLVILLAVSMLVPSIVPAVGAQDPGDPEPPDPEPPDPEIPPGGEEPDPGDVPPGEDPEIPPGGEEPDPGDVPPGEDPEIPPGEEQPDPDGLPDPSSMESPRATYLEEGFEDLTGFAQVELDGDRQNRPIWSIEPVGHNDSKAAVLADSQGLPRGLHQGLVSPQVDLTPVPSTVEDPTVTSAADAGIDRSNRAAQETFHSGAAAPESVLNSESVVPVELQHLRNNPLFELGPISLPKGPASLTLQHSFNFDDTRNEDGEAVSGFAIEARTPDGDWVPLEASMLVQPAHGADATGPRMQAQEVSLQDQEPCQYERLGQSLIDIAVAAEPFFIQEDEFDEDQVPVPAECESGSISTSTTPEPNELLLTAGDTTVQVSTGPTSNETRDEGSPVVANAHVQPLDQRGFTGHSDTDDDGEPDVVGHQFDLSPWAGEEVELRFRAGTSAVTDVPGGFWALDHAEVRAGAPTADLRVDLTAPDGDHVAPPESHWEENPEDFPVRAQIQNIGFTAQEGPFEIEFTVLQDGVVEEQQVVQAPVQNLAFLETATAQLDLTVTGSAPYDVQAEIVSDHADQNPTNDADADVLPIGVDESAEIDVLPEAPVVEPGELSTTTVVVTSDSNVPIDANLTLTAFPYDPATQLPIGEGSLELGTASIQLPRDADKHPIGVEDAVQSATFTRTLNEGSYLLVAELGESTARAPLGVGSPPPPLLSEDFSETDPGPASFTLGTPSGDWTVHPDSDVGPVAPVLDPGSVANGTAWVPLEHESTAVRPQGGQNITSGNQSTPNPAGGEEDGCLLTALEIVFGDECPEGETPPTGTNLVLESPKGTQRVHAMATDVALHDASEAKLSYLSSLIPPKDSSGISEARVYVATDQGVQSMLDQVTDPENCPAIEDTPEETDQVLDALDELPVHDQDACEIANVISFDANRIVQSVFDLEENVRCTLPHTINSSIGGSVTNTTCPGTSGDEPSGECNDLQGVTQGEDSTVCHIDEPSQLDALVPMLSGTLVERTTTPHAWKANEIDLGPWTGENVTIGFVFIGESQETTETYNLRPYGEAGEIDVGETMDPLVLDPLSGTIGYEPPGHSQGAFLTSRIQVTTDEGVKLAPENTDRITNEVANSAQSFRRGVAETGWTTIGYDHVSELGDPQTPLRSHAQLLTGEGTPVAEGADAKDGLRLGVSQDTREGVAMYPRDLHGAIMGSSSQSVNEPPADLHSPHDDPAVTVVASPEIDLSGTENPQLRFRQSFDLGTHHRDQGGPQGVAETLDHDGVAKALGLPGNVTDEDECDLGGRNTAVPVETNVTLAGLACVLEEKRTRDDADYDVQNSILNGSVAQPAVSAGLFVQARVLTDDGEPSEPRIVHPVDGYRYPFGDPGGFEPTLDYTVNAPDTYPGYTVGKGDSLWQQDAYIDSRETLFGGTPAWAGDSDVDGDGVADWVTSELDLSPFEDEQIVLEFVLVARQNEEEPGCSSGPGPGCPPGTILSNQPWSLDDVEVVESEVEGEVAIEELRWPNTDLGVVTPGEDLPVRTTVTTPTGLDDTIHAKTVLVDNDGCVQGTAQVQAQYENEAGRVEPMPAGAQLEMPDMIVPGENVTGATPWEILVGVDVGQEPSVLAPSSVETKPIEGPTSRWSTTGALNVSQGAEITMEAQDPNCDPAPDILTVVPSGIAPVVDKDTATDDELTFEVELAEDDSFVNENRLSGDTQRSFEMDDDDAPMLLAVSDGDGSDAGGTSLLMFADAAARERTASVQAPERVPAGSPVDVTLDVPRDLEEAYLWTVDPSDARPSADLVWPADSSEDVSLRATQDRTIPVTLDEPGPHLLVLTGDSDEADSVLGGTLIVARAAESAGDPSQIDNKAQISTIAGAQEELTVERVDVTPSSGLSTTSRTVEAVVQNTGTTTLTDLTVTFSTKESSFETKTRDVLRAGERATFTHTPFETGKPSVVVRVDATADEGVRASGAAPVRSLVDLGSLTPRNMGDDEDGWQTDGTQALFQDEETGEAPRDTSGSLNLLREPSRPEEGVRMEGMAGVAVQLDHTLDMEERFDGGQVLLSNGTETRPLTVGQATQEMGAYSQIPGQEALTGVRDVSDETVALDAADTAKEQTLLEQTGAEALGYPLLADDPGDDPDDAAYATCESRTFLDDRIEVDTGQPYCAYSEPAVPVPSSIANQGIFHFQPASFLSSEEGWNVSHDASEYRFTPREATSYVFLEAGRDLVASAQEQDKLEISFDEARKLDPFDGAQQRPMSVEVCARFMQATEDDIDLLPPQRRCTGLTHEEADGQVVDLDWSQKILSVGDIPQAPLTSDDRYNIVRLELSLQQERYNEQGVGVMGANNSGVDSIRIQEPVKGWFVGPVTASAGGTSQTWVPDEDALTSTDPNSGLDPSEVQAEVDEDPDLNPVGDKGRLHVGEPVEQSATLGLTEIEVVEVGEGLQTTTSTVSQIASDGRPEFNPPLPPCSWHEAGGCAWQDLIDAYAESNWAQSQAGWGEEGLAAATAPYAMNLTCTLPSAIAEDSISRTSGCEGSLASRDLPGMGVQVIDTSNVDRGSSSTCDSDIGPPVLWRTQCLHVRRADTNEDGEFEEEDDEGESLKFANSHVTNLNSEEVPLRSRGHSLDYRLVVPVDLRYAADGAEAWAMPDFEAIGDGSGKVDLQAEMLAQARIQGQENWEDVPRCGDRFSGDCPETKQAVEEDNLLDLSEYVGQQIELAFRINHPHPMIMDGEHTNLTEPEAAFVLHDLAVDAGYLSLIDYDMQLRAFTDPSIQGEGWNVREVRLFGLPIQANVGIDEVDSKALVADELHVHADPAAERDVYMSVPANLTVYNQGVDKQTLPLEGALEARNGSGGEWYYSTSEAWTGDDEDEDEIDAPGTCEVEIQRTDPEAVSADEVHLEPGQSKQIGVRANFIPDGENGRLDPGDEDTSTQAVLGQCFPGQFDDEPDDDGNDEPQASNLEFRLRVNLTEGPEDDYVASDDTLRHGSEPGITLRPNPFLAHGDKALHRAELEVTAFEVDPTRPAEGQPVQVSANVSLRDRTDRGADLALDLVEPGSDEVVVSLAGAEADTPITTFQPYRTTTLNWTLSEYPDDELLVRFTAEIVRDGNRIESGDDAWIAPGDIQDDVLHYSAEEFELDVAGDAGYTVEDGRTVVATGGSGGADGDGEALEAAIATPWFDLEDSPPPLVAIKARWNFQGDVWNEEEHEVLDGWAVQVCHVPDENPDGDDCPIDADGDQDVSNEAGRAGDDDWAWRTTDIVRSPEDTLAGAANPEADAIGPPGGDCGDDTTPQGSEQFQDLFPSAEFERCSAIAAGWSNMYRGETMLTNRSPGFSRSLEEEGALRTVIAPLSDCSLPPTSDELETPVVDCPSWNTTDRHNNVRVRLVALGADGINDAALTVTDLTLAPVGVRGQTLQATDGEPIPEEAPKAIPMEASSLGAIGTKVDTHVDEPEGWDATIENLPSTNAIEADTRPRLLVEAPISPSGISQSATLSPAFDVEAEPLRGIETLVPIGVRAGQHPDLVVEDVELSDDVKREDEALVQVRIKNDGFETSEEVEVTGVARYDNGQVNLLEPPQGQDRVLVDALPPGVEETVVLTWTPTESGDATVRIGADLTRPEPLSGPVVNSWDGGELAELKECDGDCNNVGTQRIDVRPPREADTSVDVEVLAERPLVVGEPVDVRITVHNDGPATVPAYEVRLLAGVVSLLEDDPLRVTDPLEAGDSWSTTVEMIPGFGGDLDLVAQVSADESLVRELRGLQPGGGTYDEDNVDDRRIPVVARGLTIDVPRIVSGGSIADNGTLEVPVTLTNLGSEALNVSAAADAGLGIGTLVDDEGDPLGTVDLEPGEAQNATLLLLYEQLPDAGRQPVAIDAVSKAGLERTSLDVEVPARSDVTVRPVVERASAGKILLPVTIDATGNAPVQAQIAVDAPGVSPASRTIEIEPHNTTHVELPAWLDASSASTMEGQITVRADSFTRHAPLRIVQEGDVMPTIKNARAVGGSSPHTWVRVANLGSTAGSFDLALVQDGATLAEETVRLAGGTTTNATLDALPEPGPARVQLTSPATDANLNWTMDVPDLQPDISVLHSRLDPLSPEAGETVEIQATIANEGGSAVDIRPGLFVDGMLHTVSAQEQTVEPGGVTSVTLEWIAESGDHTLSVSADPQDRIEDERSTDDAIANQVEIQSDATSGALNVPAPAVSTIVALLAGLALLWRGRKE